MSRTPIAFILALSVCGTALAQESAERFEQTFEDIQRNTQAPANRSFPLNQRALVDYGAYLTCGYLSFDDASHSNHGLREYELVAYGLLNIDGVHEAYFRGRADYRNYNPGDVVFDEADRLQGRVEEGWYRFDLQRYAAAYQGRKIDFDVAVKGGRQFVAWGNGLTLDQYVDGISAEFRNDRVVLDVLAGITVEQTIDFDISRPHFYNDTYRGFYGVDLTVPVGRQRPYVFILGQKDYNPNGPLDAHVIPTRYRYDSYYGGVGINGAVGDRLLYGGEFCFEGGEDLSNSFLSSTNEPVAQTKDRIEAYAADFRVDYLPGDPRRTRFILEGVLASGDNDRINSSATFGGNRPNSVDHAFNALALRYLGFAFQPQISNVLVLHLGASTFPLSFLRPLKELQIGGDLFVYGKLDRQAPVMEPTTNRTYLGIEPDAAVNWQVTDDLTLAVRYGIFFPGAAIPAGNPDHHRQFVYASATYAF